MDKKSEWKTKGGESYPRYHNCSVSNYSQGGGFDVAGNLYRSRLISPENFYYNFIIFEACEVGVAEQIEEDHIQAFWIHRKLSSRLGKKQRWKS